VAEYVYEGPGPQLDPEGGIARPGDRREFDEEPAWGPWRLLDPPDGGAESDSPASGTQAPAPAPESPAPSGSAPPVTASAPAPLKEM